MANGASGRLRFEGRLLYGRASNDVDALLDIGIWADPRIASLGCERLLAQSRVEGT